MASFSDRVVTAATAVRALFAETPLQENDYLSKKTGARILLKREDLTPVRSYKIRGAFNFFRKALAAGNKAEMFVCASAGNHAQGFAFVCRHFGKKGVVFMPVTTPQQKIDKTRLFGGEFVEIRLHGDFFDECYRAAQAFSEIDWRTHGAALRPPRHHRGPGDGGQRDPRPDARRTCSRHGRAAGRRRRSGRRRDALFSRAGTRDALRLLRTGRRPEPRHEPRRGPPGEARGGRQFRRRRSSRRDRPRTVPASQGFPRRLGEAHSGKPALRNDDRDAECGRRGA